MSEYPVRIGGVFRCCMDHDFPADPKEGDVLPCKYCKDGLLLVTRDGKTAWEAAWITLGHGWRAASGSPVPPEEETR